MNRCCKEVVLSRFKFSKLPNDSERKEQKPAIERENNRKKIQREKITTTRDVTRKKLDNKGQRLLRWGSEEKKINMTSKKS